MSEESAADRVREDAELIARVRLEREERLRLLAKLEREIEQRNLASARHTTRLRKLLFSGR